ncbi:MAG: M24 family metallopeptidase [Paracoccaceae bacterium]|nr:M24 family metallopeptidase [Paracoccaceae bacterium]
MAQRTHLDKVPLPEFGVPDRFPELAPGLYLDRLERLKKRASDAGFEALAIYSDREHFANLAYICGVDPRFEEALLVIVGRNEPVLITGPENQGYAGVSPLDFRLVLYPPFGLLGQNRSQTPEIEEVMRELGLREGVTTGVIGWKYFTSDETAKPASWLEIPSYLADALRTVVGEKNVRNATDLFMHPTTGMRTENEIDQIAQFEYAASHVSEAVKRVLRALKPGITERDLSDELRLGRLPLSCHPMISSGGRTRLGLASPSDKVIERGEPFQIAVGVQGALTCRAGWVAEGPDDLPAEVRDYVEVLAGPYFECAAEWYQTVGIGVTGGKLDALVKSHLGDPFFGVTLNPGHLIHLDEWMNSPIYPGSQETLRSGQAIQLDIIPATGSAYGTANIEDGIVLLDEKGRSEFADRYPGAWARIEMRRSFLREMLNVSLKPEVLPMSNLAGYFAPFMLSPSHVFTRSNA